MDTVAWTLSTIRSAASEALALVLPVTCAGCDEADVALCEACAAELEPHPVRRLIAGPGEEDIAVWSGLSFEGVTARVLRALKEDGRTGLARSLAPALTAAVAAARDPTALIVPVPTSRAGFRRRGYRVNELIAGRAGIRLTTLLAPTRRTADQRGLDQRLRRANVAGSLTARDAANRRVLVLDDVVTTGATLAEAVRALRAAGADVAGAITVAATPRRRPGDTEVTPR